MSTAPVRQLCQSPIDLWQWQSFIRLFATFANSKVRVKLLNFATLPYPIGSVWQWQSLDRCRNSSLMWHFLYSRISFANLAIGEVYGKNGKQYTLPLPSTSMENGKDGNGKAWPHHSGRLTIRPHLSHVSLICFLLTAHLRAPIEPSDGFMVQMCRTE